MLPIVFDFNSMIFCTFFGFRFFGISNFCRDINLASERPSLFLDTLRRRPSTTRNMSKSSYKSAIYLLSIFKIAFFNRFSNTLFAFRRFLFKKFFTFRFSHRKTNNKKTATIPTPSQLNECGCGTWDGGQEKESSSYS